MFIKRAGEHKFGETGLEALADRLAITIDWCIELSDLFIGIALLMAKDEIYPTALEARAYRGIKTATGQKPSPERT